MLARDATGLLRYDIEIDPDFAVAQTSTLDEADEADGFPVDEYRVLAAFQQYQDP